MPPNLIKNREDSEAAMDVRFGEIAKSFSGSCYTGPSFAKFRPKSEIILSASGTVLSKGQTYVKPEFEYVRKKQVPARICFGSAEKRHTSPIGKHLSAFQKREMPENFPRTSPNKYDQRYSSSLYQSQNKVRSRKGIGFLAGNAPRLPIEKVPRVPSPTAYDLSPRRDYKQCRAPFNTTSIRPALIRNKNPLPGISGNIRQCRRTKVDYNFGKPKAVPAVEITCMPKPLHRCDKCNQLCNFDYWKKDDEHYLCHECWREAKAFEDDDYAGVYKEYKKVRNCSFMHSHEGTKAAVRLLPKHVLVNKLKLENYLNLYLTCYSRK